MKEKASAPQLDDDYLDETFDGVLEAVEHGPTHVDKLPDADYQKNHPGACGAVRRSTPEERVASPLPLLTSSRAAFQDVCDESDVAAAKPATKAAPAPKQQ